METPKNKIILQRIDKNGTVYNITLDANGKPIEPPSSPKSPDFGAFY